jgi:hypothetical protein
MRENITTPACCNASWMYIPLMVIFNVVRKRPVFQNGLLPGSSVEVSDSVYANKVQFFVMAATLYKIQNTGFSFSHFE